MWWTSCSWLLCPSAMSRVLFHIKTHSQIDAGLTLAHAARGAGIKADTKRENWGSIHGFDGMNTCSKFRSVCGILGQPALDL